MTEFTRADFEAKYTEWRMSVDNIYIASEREIALWGFLLGLETAANHISHSDKCYCEYCEAGFAIRSIAKSFEEKS